MDQHRRTLAFRERSSVGSPAGATPAGDMEERLRNVLERITDGFVAYDRAFRFTYINGRAERYFGRRREDLLGKVVWDEFPSVVGTTFYREVHRAVAEQTPIEFAMPATLSDTWYGVNAYPSVDGLSVYFRDITAQRRAEQALRESEARYRSLFDNSSDGVLLTSPDGRIWAANPAACRMLGYPEEELLRLGRQSIADPEDERWPAALRQRARNGRARAELAFRRADGSRIEVEMTSAIYLDELGAQRACVILHDPTELRRVQREAGVQEARFRRLVEASHEGIWATSEDGATAYVNQRMATMLGYAPGELLRLRLADLLVDEAESARAAALLGRREGSWASVSDCALRRRDGELLWVMMSTTPLLRDTGEPLGTLTMVADITARRQREEELRFLTEAGKEIVGPLVADERLDNLTRLVVPRLADICVVDLLEGDLVRRAAVAHQSASATGIAELRRFAPGEPRSCGVDRVLRTGEPELVVEVTDTWLRAAAVDDEHLRVARAIAPRSLLCVPLLIEGRAAGALTFVLTRPGRRYGPADLAFARSIAEWAALAVAHSHLYQRAVRASQERDDVLAIVSHDLRSPLHNIALAAHLARADGDVERQLARIERASTWATQLLEDLLDGVRIASGGLVLTRTACSIAALADEAIELHRPAAEHKRIELGSELAPDLPAVHVDRDRVIQVLGNLLDNAIEHTPNGGRVTLSAALDGAEARVSITDTGPGIPPDRVGRVFDRFWQVRGEKRRGAGLGLAIAKGIVEGHGGRIDVRTTAGVGTTFSFTLPLEKATVF